MTYSYPTFTPRELRLAYEEGAHAANLAKPAGHCPYLYGVCLPLRCQWMAGYHDQQDAVRQAVEAMEQWSNDH